MSTDLKKKKKNQSVVEAGVFRREKADCKRVSFHSLERSGKCGDVRVGHTVAEVGEKHIDVPFWMQSHPPKAFWVAKKFL